MIIDFHAHFYNQDWFPQKFWDGMVSRAVSVRKKFGEIVSPETIRGNLFKHYGDLNGIS